MLFVDDEEMLVNLGKEMLISLGYQVECRTSPVEALELFRNRPDHFDLVISDMIMPNMTGEMLAKEIRMIRPDLPVILCTGFSRSVDVEQVRAMGVHTLLMKPISVGDLAKTIRDALG